MNDGTVDDLVARAATFDELLSVGFESDAAGSRASGRTATRLAAWRDAAASGDQNLFERRLRRDGHTTATAADHLSGTAVGDWADDARWVYDALQCADTEADVGRVPFEPLFCGLARAAELRLWRSAGTRVASEFLPSARTDLRNHLLHRLSGVYAAPIFTMFSQSGTPYQDFIGYMKNGGLRQLLADKPVLLRLITAVTTQWLDTSVEFVTRLHSDRNRIRARLQPGAQNDRVIGVDDGYSDAHRGGRTVLRVRFDDGRAVMYKPKDLRVDVAWHALLQRLNIRAPVRLRAARVLACDGYGWMEFVEHRPCDDLAGCRRYFRRAGAWLALLHCFAATDIHHENLIAAGDHPVPIDLETLLQGDPGGEASTPAELADQAARAVIANSVTAVGLLPSYRRSDAGLHSAGGMAAQWPQRNRVVWNALNTDAMRPLRVPADPPTPANLPWVGVGAPATLTDHFDDFLAGFVDYARFLRGVGDGDLFAGFSGLPVRTVLRPTQFYAMLLERLTDDGRMADGVLWSVQADFGARLADWDRDEDPMWPIQRAERAALLDLNVPFFTTRTDDCVIDGTGVVIAGAGRSGLQRARERLSKLDDREISWQVAVIRQTCRELSGAPHDTPETPSVPATGAPVSSAAFLAEADAVAGQIAEQAIREGTGAAWIGSGWLADSDVAQLSVLGPDLYNGTGGLAVFLAAHARTTGSGRSADLALAALAPVVGLVGSNRLAHVARVRGIGAATGIGSMIYGLTVVAGLLGDNEIRSYAVELAHRLGDELIATDRHLDVISGAAGAILALLRLHRDTGSEHVLDRAVACGTHLLAQPRIGARGRRSWPCRTADGAVLGGMSHGTSGFAYALSALAGRTGREDFVRAAGECLEFEQANFDGGEGDWCDRRTGRSHSSSQWCHGAVGIGLARLAMMKGDCAASAQSALDVERALTAAAAAFPGPTDTLCCGTLGAIELLREAGQRLGRTDLDQRATEWHTAVLQARQLTGDYRWTAALPSRFNVGLFRGLAGAGYTCLRAVDPSLPNLLIWE
jgi:type 2 lantibiotic biosynthesis protein LanM